MAPAILTATRPNRNIRTANLDPQATIVRIVGPTDPNFAADLEFVRTTSYTTVMVPKVYADLPAGLDGLNIIAMIETPQAVVNIHKIAEHPQVVALFWGAEDLTMGSAAPTPGTWPTNPAPAATETPCE